MTSSHDKKRLERDLSLEQKTLTSRDLYTILEVNRKAIEIQVEVEKQNENIIEILTSNKDKIDAIDKKFFKLLAVLSTLTVGTIIELIRLFSHK